MKLKYILWTIGVVNSCIWFWYFVIFKTWNTNIEFLYGFLMAVLVGVVPMIMRKWRYKYNYLANWAIAERTQATKQSATVFVMALVVLEMVIFIIGLGFVCQGMS